MTKTREELLSSARSLFSQRDFASVSTRELADDAQVNLGSIKYHFHTKENLFVEALLSLLNDEPDVEDIYNNMSSREALFESIKNYVGSMLDVSKSRGCKIAHREILGETPVKDIIVDAVVNKHCKPRFEVLRTLLREVKPSLSNEDVDLIAVSIVGQVTYFLTGKDFIEGLVGWDLSDPETIEKISTNIANQTLTMLGENKC